MTGIAISIGIAGAAVVANLFRFWQLCDDVRALRRIAENEHQWFTQDTNNKGDRP